MDMAPEGRNHITFKNHQNQVPVPYVIYADFESIIKPKTEKAGDNSELTSEHESCGFGYQVVKCDGAANAETFGIQTMSLRIRHTICKDSMVDNEHIAAAARGSRRRLPKAGVERSSYVGIAYTISVKLSN